MTGSWVIASSLLLPVCSTSLKKKNTSESLFFFFYPLNLLKVINLPKFYFTVVTCHTSKIHWGSFPCPVIVVCICFGFMYVCMHACLSVVWQWRLYCCTYFLLGWLFPAHATNNRLLISSVYLLLLLFCFSELLLDSPNILSWLGVGSLAEFTHAG